MIILVIFHTFLTLVADVHVTWLQNGKTIPIDILSLIIFNRFVSDSEDIDMGIEQLTPQMDLFSLGCVLAELFTEASNFELFDLSSLLSYRKQKNVKDIHLKIDTIADESFRKLISNLIDIDPSERNSSTQHLHEMMPNVFPSYFNVLFDYFKELIFCAPDEKVLRLSADVNSLIRPVIAEDSNGMLLILTMITSSLRALKHVHAKVLFSTSD